MATIKDGIVKGLKTAAIPAALAMILAESDVPPDSKGVAPTLGVGWDKGKVGLGVLGAGAAVGAGSALKDIYVQGKMQEDRVRAAQKAVLAQNNLLTMQNHKGDTKYIEPRKKDMSMGDVVRKSVEGTMDLPQNIAKITSKVSEVHPIAGTVTGSVASLGAGMLRGTVARGLNTVQKGIESTVPQLLNSGTNPANPMVRNFSEEESFFVGLDPSVSENMTGSLADFIMEVKGNELDNERVMDMLGSMYPVAVSLSKSDFSAGDFGLLSAVTKGLTHGTSFLKRTRMLLPGKKGARSATTEVFNSVAKNSSDLGSSLSKNLKEVAEGSSDDGVAKTVGNIANKVESAGKTVSAFAKTGAENPDVARSMVKSFRAGSTAAGLAAGASLANRSRHRDENVAPPQLNNT